MPSGLSCSSKGAGFRTVLSVYTDRGRRPSVRLPGLAPRGPRSRRVGSTVSWRRLELVGGCCWRVGAIVSYEVVGRHSPHDGRVTVSEDAGWRTRTQAFPSEARQGSTWNPVKLPRPWANQVRNPSEVDIGGRR
jgi:hypothetical protein